MFKVGDLIEGKMNNEYSITNDNMYIGIVIGVYTDSMLVKILNHKDKDQIGESYFVDNDVRKFSLIGHKVDKPELLDKKEKEFLENVIRPLKSRIKYIIVERNYLKENLRSLTIKIKSKYIPIGEEIGLPYFEKGKMYKNLKEGIRYTLQDLGLFEGDE